MIFVYFISYEIKAHNLSEEELIQRVVDTIDIVNESVPDYKYKESEDPKKVQIIKTNPNRGPLKETWKTDLKQDKIPLMCAYKVVKVKFEVWGLQTRVESYAQRAIRDILLLAHKQAFCWTDEWIDKSYEKIVEYERETYKQTNEKVLVNQNSIINEQSDVQLDINNNKDLSDFD